MGKLPPGERRRVQVVAGSLILGPTLFLGVGFLMRAMGVVMGEVPVLPYAAAGVALLSPVLAGSLRASAGERFAGEAPRIEDARRAVIVPFAILEGAAFLCGVAFLLTPTYWPALAALVPLGTMLLWFPRG